MTRSRQTVLAIPGLVCDGLVFERLADALADLAEVVVADLAPYDDLTAMAWAALAEVAGPVHVVGHSLGGRVALEIWREAPERVRSLVLMDTGVHGVRPGEAEVRQEMLDTTARGGMAALADAWLPQMVGPSRRDDAAVMAPLRAMVMRATPEQYVRQVRALLTRPDATDLLATIDVPTLLVVGRHDAWSPPEQHAEMVAAIPDARLEIVEDAGHFVTVEQPAVVTALLRDWFERRTPPAVA